MGNFLSKTALLITASFGAGESALVDVDCEPTTKIKVYCCRALDDRFNPYGSIAKDEEGKALFWGCVNEGTIWNKNNEYIQDPGADGHFYRLSAVNSGMDEESAGPSMWDGECGYGFEKVVDSICEASKKDILVHGSATGFTLPEEDREEYNNHQPAGEGEPEPCPSCLQKAKSKTTSVVPGNHVTFQQRQSALIVLTFLRLTCHNLT